MLIEERLAAAGGRHVVAYPERLGRADTGREAAREKAGIRRPRANRPTPCKARRSQFGADAKRRELRCAQCGPEFAGPGFAGADHALALHSGFGGMMGRAIVFAPMDGCCRSGREIHPFLRDAGSACRQRLVTVGHRRCPPKSLAGSGRRDSPDTASRPRAAVPKSEQQAQAGMRAQVGTTPHRNRPGSPRQAQG